MSYLKRRKSGWELFLVSNKLLRTIQISTWVGLEPSRVWALYFILFLFLLLRAVFISPPFLPLSPLHLHPLFPHSLVTHPKSQTLLANPNIPHTRNPIRKNEPNLLQPLIHYPNSKPTSNFHVINPTQLLMNWWVWTEWEIRGLRVKNDEDLDFESQGRKREDLGRRKRDSDRSQPLPSPKVHLITRPEPMTSNNLNQQNASNNYPKRFYTK